ncbi:MAG: ShlB/FhaC/HecB family hemolysin secretion/activation protein [Gammaproteobacteria bacterium]|nr:ShlB/FhaC/HecB family hemolysin secretion/activation protein [Gammaproteobacteria bacterium]
MVENIRFIIMDEGKLLESGYTIDELGEISDLLVEIEEETVERHVSPLEVQKLVWLIREQRGKRGVTLGQIEAVANKITSFYRERGFILAKAFIPKQRVRDGVVSLTLLLGVLGEISVKNNDMYNAETLRSVFDDFLTKPVTNKAVEENLFIINSFPGINVDGYFEPGYQVGDTRLNINVKNEARYNANLRVDNHGTDESGLYRFYADFQVNNLLGIADYMKIGLLQAKSPDNTTYWQLAFESNFFSPRFRAGIESSRNQFVVDQTAIEGFDLSGEVDVLGIYGTYMQERGRTKNSSYEFRVETIKSDTKTGSGGGSGTKSDELRHASIKYNLDYLDDVNKRLHEGNVKYTRGKFEVGTIGQDENYNILSADYTLLTFLRIPFTESTSRLIFRSSLQYSGTSLSAIARFSLSGPTRVRGFSPSFFTADDALYLGTNWVFNSPDIFDVQIGSFNFKSFAKPFVFADYGYGKQYEPDGSKEKDPTGQLANVGAGLQFSHSYNFSGNLQLAYKILDQFTDISAQPKADDIRLLFDMQYSF